MLDEIETWLNRWGAPAAAADELRAIVCANPAALFPEPDGRPKPEAAVVQEIRVRAALAGVTLFRNNSGVAMNPAGRPVRFGLGNDSKKINEVRKSSDLIGVAPDGRFLAIECKAVGWEWKGTAREQAQANFMNQVRKAGAVATFATCWETVRKALKL